MAARKTTAATSPPEVRTTALYRLTWPVGKGIMRTTFRLLGSRVRRSGTENVPRTGGVLFCPNHLSDADPAAMAITLPRNAWFMAKSELFDVPMLGALMRLWHGFPVKRDSPDRAALRRAEELLKAGEPVVIFPEGGGNAEGTLQPLHPGALLVALRTRVPVVPVALVNTNQIWTYGAPLPHRTHAPISVTYGEPLDLSDLAGKRGAIEAATTRLAERLATMLHQPVPAGKPKRHDDADEPEDAMQDAAAHPGAHAAAPARF